IRYKKTVAEKGSFNNIADLVNNKVPPTKITLRDNNTTVVVDFRDIYFIEAQGSYSRIQFEIEGHMREIVTSNPLSDYEDMLPANIFFRIHRSYLANCLHIKKILSDDTTTAIVGRNISL